MFRSVPMVHLQVQVPATEAAAVTRCIAHEGLLHLVEVAHGRVSAEGAPAGRPELLARFRDLAKRARRLAERVGGTLGELSGGLGDSGEAPLEQEANAIESELLPLERSTNEAWRRAFDASERCARARAALRNAERLRESRVAVEQLRNLRFTDVRLGVASPDDLSALAALLSPAPFVITPLEVESGTVFAAVAVPVSSREHLDGALGVVPFESIELPSRPEEWVPSTLQSELHAALEDEENTRSELETKQIPALAALANLWRRAQLGVLLLQAQAFFVTSGRFVVLSGWIPEESVEHMRQAVLAVTHEKAVVEVQKPEDLPEASSRFLGVPILHRNPLLLRPFQKLVELYDTPSYREVEPTAFFAISFLLMFGLMFGDVGHGFVLFSAGYLLFRRFPMFLDYGILLMEGGVASAAFGLLYGSLFGIEGLLPVLWMEPIHDLPRFMTVAVGFGALMISGGLLLNVVNAWRSGERIRAVFDPHGLFGTFLYWVILLLVARIFVPINWVLPVWVLGLMLAVAVATLMVSPVVLGWIETRRGEPARRGGPGSLWLTALEGSVELVDAMLSYFANTVSFVRIAAFAAVHAGAFVAIFAIADTVDHLRFGGPLAVITLVVGNVLVILLEGLIVSVQVLRLVYYEFFGKFFRGGGAPYRPLMLRSGAAKGGSK